MHKIILLVFFLLINVNLVVTQASASSGMYKPKRIPVCYDFGCKEKSYVTISQSEWQRIINIFASKADSAEVERIKIAKAVAEMEIIIGNYTPIHRDIGYNVGKDAIFPGQLDCIDESINTTTYLSIFEMANFFNHHKTTHRAYRKALFDQHWSGQIQQLDNDQKFVVDTWFKKNGELPLVQPIDQWMDIPIYTSY